MSDWERLMLHIETAGLILFAVLGGVLGYSYRTMRMSQKVMIWRALLEGGAAGFVGLLVVFICMELHLSPYWTGTIVGVCSWLGADATIRMLEKLVYRKFGLTVPNPAFGEPYVPTSTDTNKVSPCDSTYSPISSVDKLLISEEGTSKGSGDSGTDPRGGEGSARGAT